MLHPKIICWFWTIYCDHHKTPASGRPDFCNRWPNRIWSTWNYRLIILWPYCTCSSCRFGKLFIFHYWSLWYLKFMYRKREEYLVDFCRSSHEKSWTFLDTDEVYCITVLHNICYCSIHMIIYIQFETDLVKMTENDLLILLNQFNFEQALVAIFSSFRSSIGIL